MADLPNQPQLCPTCLMKTGEQITMRRILNPDHELVGVTCSTCGASWYKRGNRWVEMSDEEHVAADVADRNEAAYTLAIEPTINRDGVVARKLKAKAERRKRVRRKLGLD